MAIVNLLTSASTALLMQIELSTKKDAPAMVAITIFIILFFAKVLIYIFSQNALSFVTLAKNTTYVYLAQRLIFGYFLVLNAFVRSPTSSSQRINNVKVLLIFISSMSLLLS